MRREMQGRFNPLPSKLPSQSFTTKITISIIGLVVVMTKVHVQVVRTDSEIFFFRRYRPTGAVDLYSLLFDRF